MNTKSRQVAENLWHFRRFTLCVVCALCVCVLFRDDANAQGMSSDRDFSYQADPNNLQAGLTDSCAADEVQKEVRIFAQKVGSPCPTGPYLCKDKDRPTTTVPVSGMFQCNAVAVGGEAGKACGEKKSLVAYRFLSGNYILECPKPGAQAKINAVLCVKCQDLPETDEPQKPDPRPTSKPKPTSTKPY